MSPILAACAICVFVAAAAGDLARRRIPNRLVLALALLGLVRLGLLLGQGGPPMALALDLGASLAVFLAGAAAFQAGLFGGGDVKLLAAGVLWIGAGGALPFVVATVITGGVLALAFVAAALIGRGRGPDDGRVSLPYGVAIATGGILTTVAAL